MFFISQQQPVQLLFFIPFNKLAKLLAHKQQFLAWMCHHIAQKSTDASKFQFIVPWHFID